MSANITIRPALKSDAAEIALLVNIAVHGSIGYGWARDPRSEGTYDAIEVGRQDMLREDTLFSWRSATMAEIDGEVAGMLLGYREPDWANPVPPHVEPFMRPILELEEAAEGMWFVSMLGVHKPWRSRGVGSRLLDIADGKWRETKARGVALIVEDSNAGARALYERRGFAVRDKRPMVAYPGGDRPGRDWLLMVKDR